MNCNSVKSLKLLHVAFIFLFSINLWIIYCSTPCGRGCLPAPRRTSCLGGLGHPLPYYNHTTAPVINLLVDRATHRLYAAWEYVSDYNTLTFQCYQILLLDRNKKQQTQIIPSPSAPFINLIIEPQTDWGYIRTHCCLRICIRLKYNLVYSIIWVSRYFFNPTTQSIW